MSVPHLARSTPNKTFIPIDKVLPASCATALLIGMLLVAGSAQALSVAGFDSLNGAYTFSNFSNFSMSGAAVSLDDISIEATEDGFDIVMHDGAMTVQGGERR
jgi:hypothetical protein